MFKTSVAIVVSILPLSFAAWGQTTNRACPAGSSQILILGSYHMSNPGLDSVNVEADDVLSPRRQKEIADLVDRLAKFAPTKIAIEAPYRDERQPAKYKQYLSGQYALGRNEIEQIGFRVAQALHLPTIYGVDYPMSMSGLTPGELDYSAPYPAPKPADAAPPKPRNLSSEERLLQTSTVAEYLLHLNTTDAIRKDQASYMKMLLPDVTSPAIYGRTDLVTNWYKRNLRIMANLNRVTEVGKDRVLLVIGSGHLAILRQLASDSNYYCLVGPEDYLK